MTTGSWTKGSVGRGKRALGSDRAAVSDVIGAMLMVGITVMAAVGFAVVLFAFDGPADQLHVDIELRTTPGADGLWETGDERMELVHLGGEPMQQDRTTLSYTADAVAHTYTGTTLGYTGSAFADDGDGRMTIGEAWQSPAAGPDYLDLAQDEGVAASLASSQEGSQLIASGTVTGGGILLTAGGGSCSPDLTAPTVVLSNAPDLTSSSGGAVTITAVASDFCGPVNVGVAPHLWYRITPGPLPGPAAYTDAGAMAFQSGTTWTKSVSAPIGGWVAAAGQTLQYYVTGLVDTAASPNTLAQSAAKSDVVDPISVYRYVTSIVTTPITGIGTIGDVSKAQDDLTPGVYTVLTEGGVLGPPGSSTTTLAGTTAASAPLAGSVTNPSNVNSLTDDAARATGIDVGESVELNGFDVPAAATGVTNVKIHADVRKDANGGKDVVYRLDYKLGALGVWNLEPSTHTVTSNTDGLVNRDLAAAITSVADVETNLYVRAYYQGESGTGASHALEVDRLYIEVTYSTAAGTTYDLDLQADFTSIQAGTTHTLELVHATSIDTFNVLVYDWVATTWRTCAPVLDGSPTDYSCLLSANEVQANAARIRFTDVDVANTSVGTLSLDYLRVATL
ncbi:MAG: type IV pilin N-terminal domain-containing protein [Thermoplasmatota archaeon]